MKTILFCLVIFCCTTSFVETPSLSKVRLLYQEASREENACKEMISLLKNYDEKNAPLLLGYKASCTMMMAKYVFNPISKLSYFKNGRAMLQKAVNADSSNIELRLLRFNIQTHAPFFLDYHDSIDGDKSFLLNSIPHINDAELKKFIIFYLKKSSYLTDMEKKKFE